MSNTSATTWRVLGTLIRIRFTDPAEMPCTADYLTAACNQVGTLTALPAIDKPDVHRALAELIKMGLVRVEETMGTFRYGETAAGRFQLSPAEHAVYAVLLLNRPLTAMELLKESYRLYPFRSTSQVTETIQSLEESHPIALARHWPPTRDGEARFTHAHYEPPAAGSEQPQTLHEPPDELERKVAELEQLIDHIAPPLDHER